MCDRDLDALRLETRETYSQELRQEAMQTGQLREEGHSGSCGNLERGRFLKLLKDVCYYNLVTFGLEGGEKEGETDIVALGPKLGEPVNGGVISQD